MAWQGLATPTLDDSYKCFTLECVYFLFLYGILLLFAVFFNLLLLLPSLTHYHY